MHGVGYGTRGEQGLAKGIDRADVRVRGAAAHADADDRAGKAAAGGAVDVAGFGEFLHRAVAEHQYVADLAAADAGHHGLGGISADRHSVTAAFFVSRDQCVEHRQRAVGSQDFDWHDDFQFRGCAVRVNSASTACS